MSDSKKLQRPTTLQLVAATNNLHKISEIRPMLEPDFRILTLSDIGCSEDLREDHDTLQANALQKAEFVYRQFQVPCFADDSGLEVVALDNAPGVYSARYAGEQKNSDDNIDLLLKNLQGESNRAAQFRTVIALVGFHGTHLFEGFIKGKIIHERRGAEGFGYDPIFLPDGFNRTFAEMNTAEKNTLSHRAMAIQKLVDFLKRHS
ncbi:MAG: non-canonical purine NTP diphosphatase [Bacteroidota bacterium]